MLPHKALRHIDPAALAELEASGVPWSMVPGKKHHKLIIAGKLATVIPRGSKPRRGPATANMATTIRRAVAQAKEARDG